MSMKLQLYRSTILIAIVIGLSFIPASYAETYDYDVVGRLIKVVYNDGSSVSYEYAANGNLLEMVAKAAPPPPVNIAPEVTIVGGNRTISDTDGFAGEIINFTATATDNDGTIVTTEWLIDNEVVATGLNPNILLFDGQTLLTFKAVDNDGAAATDTVSISIAAPPLEDGWPVPYSGITPHESLGLEFNNIGVLNPQDGLIYACINILLNGNPGTFQGVGQYDIAFQIVSLQEATIGVVKAKPFNATLALNELGELPDCSGTIELSTGIYQDYIQAGNTVYGVEFELIPGDNLILRAIGLEIVGTVP